MRNSFTAFKIPKTELIASVSLAEQQSTKIFGQIVVTPNTFPHARIGVAGRFGLCRRGRLTWSERWVEATEIRGGWRPQISTVVARRTYGRIWKNSRSRPIVNCGILPTPRLAFGLRLKWRLKSDCSSWTNYRAKLLVLFRGMNEDGENRWRWETPRRASPPMRGEWPLCAERNARYLEFAANSTLAHCPASSIL